jgi:single-stranded-DNA-specific exonuclease
MTVGIECLATDNPGTATRLADELDRLNRERREIEAGMQESALAMLAGIDPGEGYSLTVHRPDWHAGVVGLLASRLKDRYHRPVFAFAVDETGLLKGSGRAIPGLHLRDALDLVTKRAPGVIERFGGHAAAAGATLNPGRLEAFGAAFEAVARELLSPGDLEQRIEIDGELAPDDLSLDFATELRRHVWGQGFPEPRFAGSFSVEGQRVVGGKHTRLTLGSDRRRFAAMRFGEAGPFPAAIDAVYRLDVNEFNGTESLQLIVEHWSA